MSYTVLARKWRPKNFAELVGQTHVMQALSNALDSNRLHHAYLFTGTRGVGKTTIARIFSKALNCQQGISATPCGVCDTCKAIDEGRFIDLIEVDASSRTKVDDTREILDNVQFSPTQGRYKVYLIDEVHMLSKSSFNALLKTLEEPPEHVKFLLATTDPHKLPSTVLSRCLQFNLMRLTQPQIQGHLTHILEQENLPFETTALAMIAKSADGSARDALSLLDQAIAYGAGEIRFEQVQTMLGLVDQQYTVAILQALADESPQQIKALIQTLSAIGVDYSALLAQLIETLHALSYRQVLGGFSDVCLLPQETITQLTEQFSADRIQLLYQIALLSKQDMPLAPDVRIGFEMALIRMLAFQPSDATASNEPIGNESDKVNNGVLNKRDSQTDHADVAASLPAQSPNESPTPVNNEPMMVDQDPQTVLAGLSSARALMAKKKSFETLTPEPASEHASDTQKRTQPFQPQPTLRTSQSERGDYNTAVQTDFNHAQSNKSMDDETPSWVLESSNVSAPSHSADSASDHLSQIKQRLKQPLGKPPGEPIESSQGEATQNQRVSATEKTTEQNNQHTYSLQSVAEVQNKALWSVDTIETNNDFNQPDYAPHVTVIEDQESANFALNKDESSHYKQEADVQKTASAGYLNYVPLNKENRLTVWLEVLLQLQPEGMAAELTRQCVLVEYSPQRWCLSVDPEQAYAKTDMAVLRLTQAIHHLFGAHIVLEFVEFDAHYTPAKHADFLAAEKQNHAEHVIQNDPVVQQFMNEFGLEVVANSVRPMDEL